MGRLIKVVQNVVTGEVTEIELTQEEVNELEISTREMEKAWAAESYKFSRAAEYPPMTEYIDAIVKNDQAQLQAYIDACLAVKIKYPKPYHYWCFSSSNLSTIS